MTRITSQNGFTLIEFMLVTAITLSAAGFLFPVGNSYLQMQTIDDTSRSVTEALRTARTLAATQSGDSAHGVKLLSGSYVLFLGQSYASRNATADVVSALPRKLEVDGLDEIVFAKRTGLPQATGTISLQLGNTHKTIDIDQYGKVSY